MLYYPEELRVGVLGHSFRELRRWGIEGLSVNTRLAFRRAVAPRAHRFVSVYRRFQIVFAEEERVRLSRSMPTNRSVKHRGHDPRFKI